MQGPIKSTLVGIASGVATYFVSVWTLGYTNALVMPSWVPLAAWEWIVVPGAGAVPVALVIHLAALLVTRTRASMALAAFIGTVVLALILAGVLGYGAKTLAGWLLGALLASWITIKLRPEDSFRPAPSGGTP